MAGYAIGGVPFNDFYGQENPDYSTIAFTSYDTDWNRTISNPYRAFEGNGAYIDTCTFAGYGNASYHRMNGTNQSGSATGIRSISNPTSDTKLYMYAFSSNVVHNVTVRYAFADSADDFLYRVVNGPWTSDDVLYQNTYEAATEQGALTFEREWDEAPTEDKGNPNNLLPNGGAYADTGAFDANDLMLLEDMPDPESDEMGFGGLIMCYALHEIELAKIAGGLFLPNFWTSLKNKFEGLSDPMSFILDAVELPLPITDYGIGPFKLGGIKVQDSSGNDIGCATYPYRFKKYNMGAIALKEVWGSEKDYSCTTISIFLPYVGVKELDPDIVLNSRLTLVLYVDRWNGDILYLLHASNNLAQQKYYRQENVVYRFAGNCGRKVPLGRVDNSNQIIQAVSGLAGIAAGYAMGGVVGAIGGAVPTIQNIAAGNFKPTVQTSGGVSGNTGRMDYQQAYLIIKRGVPEYPNNWRSEIGAPRGQELTISSLSGYTLFSTIYLENMECMAEEKEELERLLTTEGVIL